MDIQFPWLIVIPARLASTRLPRKPLQVIGNLPLVVKVYNQLLPLKSGKVELIVALDSPEVSGICDKFGIPWQMTKISHVTGSERCQEVAAGTQHPFILNVQGDEPFINTDDLRSLMQAMEKDATIEIGTLGFKNRDQADFANPNVVKIALSAANEALYFSRSPIPYFRDGGITFSFNQHQGVYAFRRDALFKFQSFPRSDLEIAESLEQLRALSNGMKIKVVIANEKSIGIDTPEDLEHARKKLASEV